MRASRERDGNAETDPSLSIRFDYHPDISNVVCIVVWTSLRPTDHRGLRADIPQDRASPDYRHPSRSVRVLTFALPTLTDHLLHSYSTFEETYNFLTPPSAVNVTVLLTPDASSYSDPLYATQGHYQGSPHPSAWYRDEAVDLSNGTEPGAPRMTGRLWYTSLGHTSDTWREAQFLGHVKAGLQWALEGPNK